MKIKLAVVGSRTINDKKFVKECIENTLDRIINPKEVLSYTPFEQRLNNIELVSGGAKGVDSDARIWAADMGIKWTEHLPQWDDHGKSAGFIRNAQIVNECTHLLCIWDGKSRGAKHSYDLAVKKEKPVSIIIYSYKG